ncbi:MAG: hypothetical protein ACTHKD_10695 [Devosia sp.]|jgi:hypothetical protein|nr:hypothetical protein [Devosia sp.]
MTNRDSFEAGDGGAMAVVAGLLVVVALMVGGVFFYFEVIGAGQPRHIDLDVRPVVLTTKTALG